MSIYNDINRFKDVLDSHRPLSEDVDNYVTHRHLSEFVFFLTLLSGGGLDKLESDRIIQSQVAEVEVKKDFLRVTNSKGAFLFLKKVITTWLNLSERHLRAFHEILMKNFEVDNVGIYRSFELEATKWPVCKHELVPVEIKKMLKKFKESSNLHPVARACRAHFDFLKISPFETGNMSVAYCILNYKLIKSGFPVTVINANKLNDYYKCVEVALCQNDYEDFFGFIAGSVKKGFEHYWDAIGIVET